SGPDHGCPAVRRGDRRWRAGRAVTRGAARGRRLAGPLGARGRRLDPAAGRGPLGLLVGGRWPARRRGLPRVPAAARPRRRQLTGPATRPVPVSGGAPAGPVPGGPPADRPVP